MVRTLRSLPHPDSLRDHLADVYELPFTGCELRRSLVNDVYELTTPAGAFVLKLYAGRPLADIRWEAGLSGHLLGKVATPPVQPLADGAASGVLALPEGDRPFVLTAFVDGRKPTALATSSTGVRGVDRAVPPRGRDLHAGTPGRRAPGGSRPVGRRDPALVGRRGAGPGARGGRRRVGKVAEGASRGIRHGVVSMDNVLVTAGVTSSRAISRLLRGRNLHDFDLAGEGCERGRAAPRALVRGLPRRARRQLWPRQPAPAAGHHGWPAGLPRPGPGPAESSAGSRGAHSQRLVTGRPPRRSTASRP